MKYFLIVTLIVIYALILSATIKPGLDAKTIETCEYWAPIRKEEYKNTKWANMDFYQSCIDNIYNTSPIGRN